MIEEVLAHDGAGVGPSSPEAVILEAVRTKQRLIESGAVPDAPTLPDAQVQPTHGDYHERNILFSAGRTTVVAVVDWERVGAAPPLYEVVRAVDFCQLPSRGWRLVEAFVDGYGEVRSYQADDMRTAFSLFRSMTIADVWSYAAAVLDGDVRAARFHDPDLARLRNLESIDYVERYIRTLTSAAELS